MKISYRNYPILEKLHNCNLGVLPVSEGDKIFFGSEASGSLLKNWKLFNPKFRESINIITDPVEKPAEKARPKLTNVILDILEKDSGDLNVSGTFLVRDFAYMIHFEVTKGSEANEMIFYIFTKDATPLLFYTNSYKLNRTRKGWVSSSLRDEVNKTPGSSTEQSLMHYIMARMTSVLCLAMLKKYAEVETKYLPANTKTKDINCKYVNDTKLGVTIWQAVLEKWHIINTDEKFRNIASNG